jgi:hypothetical protein
MSQHLTSDSELRCRLAARCYNTPKNYSYLLSGWCYQYILPDKRELGPALDIRINGSILVTMFLALAIHVIC